MSQVQSTSVTPYSDDQQVETNIDEYLGEDEEKKERDGKYLRKETLEVKDDNGRSVGVTARLDQCCETGLPNRLHYHASVYVNQHYHFESKETQEPPDAKPEESEKDIYELFTPNEDQKRCCNIRLGFYITGLFLANVVITYSVTSAILAIGNSENAISNPQQGTTFDQFLEFYQNAGAGNWVPLELVVAKNEMKLTRWLLEQGANTEAIGDHWTAAMRAAEVGSVPMLQLLAEYGANMLAQNRHGHTTLHIAISEGHVEAVKWLLDCGGVPADLLNPKHKETPMDNLVVFYERLNVRKTFSEMLQLLLSRGGRMTRLMDGLNVLHRAACEGYVEPVKEFLKAGADVNTVGLEGRTPLHFAAINGRLEVAKILVEHGANLKAKDQDGKTPVDLAKDEVVIWFKTLDSLNEE